jgi:hypothetical protein
VKAFNENVSKSLGTDMTLTAKRASFYAMEYTLPKSTKGNAWPMAFFQDRVESDVKKAYPSQSDPGWQSSAYKLIEAAYGKDRANEFFRAFKSRAEFSQEIDSRRVTFTADVMLQKMRKVPRKTNNQAYANLRSKHTIRRKKALQLAPNTPPLALVERGRRDAFVRQRQSTIGLAKASWYAAFTSLMTKGAVRNYTRAKSEEGRFIWPAECRKLQNKFGKGIGSGFVSTTGGYGRAEITSHIRYIADAFPENLQEIAIKQTRNAMRIIFELRYKNRANVQSMLKAA